MARVKRGVIAGARHKKVLKKAKGYYNARRKVFRTAKQAVIKPASMRIAIARPTSATSAHCGSRVSTPKRAFTACRTAS